MHLVRQTLYSVQLIEIVLNGLLHVCEKSNRIPFKKKKKKA